MPVMTALRDVGSPTVRLRRVAPRPSQYGGLDRLGAGIRFFGELVARWKRRRPGRASNMSRLVHHRRSLPTRHGQAAPQRYSQSIVRKSERRAMNVVNTPRGTHVERTTSGSIQTPLGREDSNMAGGAPARKHRYGAARWFVCASRSPHPGILRWM